jgi:DNA-binding response OmpR family regulator
VSEAGTLGETDAALDREAPDVIVLDITLPDGDGAVWLNRRRSGSPEDIPPVIALTGVTADADTQRIQDAGALRVLTKPVNVAQLLSALREVRGI